MVNGSVQMLLWICILRMQILRTRNLSIHHLFDIVFGPTVSISNLCCEKRPVQFF